MRPGGVVALLLAALLGCCLAAHAAKSEEHKRCGGPSCCGSPSSFFSRFRTDEEIGEWMRALVSSSSSPAFHVEAIGKSAQGKAILAGVLRMGPAPAAHAVLAMAGLHAREWTAVMALLRALESLVKDPPRVDSGMLLYVVPVANPDGLARSFGAGTHAKQKFSKGELVTDAAVPDRLWRKNGRGVDLNRNFGPAGAVFGLDNRTKSLRLEDADVFQGPRAFSEPETLALHRLTSPGGPLDRLSAVLDVHCCIGALLLPPGQPASPVADRVVAAVNRAGEGVVDFVQGDGEPGKYIVRAREAKDRASGTSSLWASRHLRVHSLVLEIRGKFQAPCSEIAPLGSEVLAALREAMDAVAEEPPAAPLEERQRRALVAASGAGGGGAAAELGIVTWASALVLAGLAGAWARRRRAAAAAARTRKVKPGDV